MYYGDLELQEKERFMSCPRHQVSHVTTTERQGMTAYDTLEFNKLRKVKHDKDKSTPSQVKYQTFRLKASFENCCGPLYVPQS